MTKITLEDVRSETGGEIINNRLMCECPLHDSKSKKSLHITINDDNPSRPVGAFCHGGCDQKLIEAHLRSLGFNKTNFKSKKFKKVEEYKYGKLIIPIPKDLITTYRNEIAHKQKNLDKVYSYRYPWSNQLLGWRIRTDEKKSDPWTLWEKEGEKKLINKAWASDRIKHKLPLYIKGPGNPADCQKINTLMIHEGEKSVNAGRLIFAEEENIMHVTWQEGATNSGQADWSVLEQFYFEEIILIPDNDDGGREAMGKLSKFLNQQLDPRKISIIDTTGFEEHFDCADITDENFEQFKEVYEGREDIKDAIVKSQPRYVYLQNPKAWIDLHDPINDEVGTVLHNVQGFNNMHYKTLGTSPEPHKTWLSSFMNPQFETLTFRPGNKNQVVQMPSGKERVNIWREQDIKIVAGDVSPFLEHIEYLVPNREYREHLLCNMAQIVQNPGERINHATVVVSDDEGVGKTTIATILEYCVGKLYAAIIKSKLVATRFNGQIANKIFIAIEEIRVGGTIDGKIDLMNEYKVLITGEDMYIEKKGIDTIRVPNYTNFMAMSNYRDCFTITNDARRWFVLFIEAKVKEIEYYKKLYKWLEEENGYEICFNYLKNEFKIPETYNPKQAPPKTPWFYEVCEMSKNEFTVQLDNIHDGQEAPFDQNMPLVCAKHYVAYLQDKYEKLKFLKQQMFIRWLVEKGARVVKEDVNWHYKKPINLWAWNNHDMYRKMAPKELAEIYQQPKIYPPSYNTYWLKLSDVKPNKEEDEKPPF